MTAKRAYGKHKTKQVVEKPKRVRKTSRRLFNVSEDMKLLKYWRTHQQKESLAQMATALSRTVQRTVESIRDRLRRYISILQPTEVKALEEMSKRNPESTVMFLIHNYISEDRMQEPTRKETGARTSAENPTSSKKKTPKTETISLNQLLNCEMDVELREVLGAPKKKDNKKKRTAN